MDLGSVAIVAVIAGLAGGAVGAALVGTVAAILQRQIGGAAPNRAWTLRTMRTYYRRESGER